MTLTEPREPITLPEADAAPARALSQSLGRFLQGDEPLRLRLEDSAGRHIEADVPPSALRLIAHVLASAAEGHPVTLVPLQAELTTQQAADLLKVSRPYLVRLLEEGKIPFHKVGTHRRVRFQDLAEYERNYRHAAEAALDEMAALNQAMGLYDDF